ncbi:Crp/Fnr family transcriptional regulator [Anditalea andensis]|uniref:Cyclic nucleotide-binding protein n=1 Tax=Anditalea andensis TaxID=1048983 RepID=A0A074KRW3_9BACT|nr:Crp/Fnr family transcriptional regulator [Anditalea andensis]KEO72691.1 cyclic nucleotide-binding protein [Anditalea andensis]
MDKLIEYILHFGNLNQKQIGFISQRVRELEINKNEYFSEAGKISHQVGFIVEGVVRVCYYNNRGEDITRYFFDENHLVVEMKSFENNIESSEYIQAVTDCKFLVISKSDWEEIDQTIIGWDTIVKRIFQKTLIEKLESRSPLVAQDATTRYLTFLEKFPKLSNRIPLSQLASYLGITQQSLSRIRKNIR